MLNKTEDLQSLPQDGYRLLEIAERLFQKNRGNFSKTLAQNTILVNNKSISLLGDHHYFVAKAYRRNGEIYEEMGDKQKAIKNYELALRHNPKVGIKKRLQILDPKNDFCKPEEKKPPFLIIYSLSSLVSYIGKKKGGPGGQAPRGTYYQISHYDDFCVYVKNHYISFDSLLGSASVSFTSNYGQFLGQEEFDHLVHKFACSTYQGHTVSISFDLKLYFFFPTYQINLAKDISSVKLRRDRSIFPTHQNNLVKDISAGVQRRDQLRCLILDKDCKRIYYSKGGTLLTLNGNLEIISKWNCEDLSTNQVNSKKYPPNALAILGLFGTPRNDEIKTAYRRKLLEVHPDLNRDDSRANEKTREVINAYEILTNYDNRPENVAYHFDVFQGLNIYFPAFEDEITSVHLSEDNNDIYLGYYSGKIILLHNSGVSERYYSCDKSIKNINKIGQYFYFVSDKISILKNQKLMKEIEDIDGFTKIIWANNLFVVINGRNIKLYSLVGELFGEVEFRDSITDVYILESNLRVITAPFFYEFKIQPPNNEFIAV